MNKFISKEVNKIYQTILNNKKLEDILLSNYLLLKREDFIGQYTKELFDEKIKEIDTINEENLINLSSLLYNNSETLKNNPIQLLVYNSFLRKEISNTFDGLDISDNVLKEIFYCYKYSSVNSFFQNNKKYFIPEYDLEQIEKNDKLNVLLEAMLKEFDKINQLLKDSENANDIDEVNPEHLSYLSQLLGYEKKDVPTLNEDSFRELVKNIIEIYKIKGTNYSFELFFNFLGFNIEINEFFFDRRYYYSKSENNNYTNISSEIDYKRYLTPENPCNNTINNLTTRTEVIHYSDIGNQYSLLEFNELCLKHGAEAVLGYSKLDKNDELYTGKIFTYFKTNYIYYNVSLGDRFPTEEEISAIQKYLDFLSPIFVINTIEARSEEEKDTIVFDGKTDFEFTDNTTKLDSDGYIATPTREYVLYNYTNKWAGQNGGKRIKFARVYNYFLTKNNKVYFYLEVNPMPLSASNIQNYWYEDYNTTVDYTEFKQYILNNKEHFREKVLYSNLTPEAFLQGDAGFVQDFDNTLATDIKALVPTKIFKKDFFELFKTKDIASLEITDIFNSEAELQSAMLTQNFREGLFIGKKIAINNNGTFLIKRYNVDINDISGGFNYSYSGPSSEASLKFENMLDAVNYSINNTIKHGTKAYIKDENLIYVYVPTNSVNKYANANNYVFKTLVEARTYFNNNISKITYNTEFYITSENRLYSFVYKNRNLKDKIYFSNGELYSFINNTSNLSFTRISPYGKIVLDTGNYYIENDEEYSFYDEEEDKENSIFYNNNHLGFRPNKEIVTSLYDENNLEFIVKFYTTTFYNEIQLYDRRLLTDTIATYNPYSVNTLPEYLMHVAIGDYTTDINLVLNNAITQLETLRDNVEVYSNGTLINPTPQDVLINYNTLINFCQMFIDYDFNDKTILINFFSDIDYVNAVLEWREKFFNDDNLDRTIIDIFPDLILGDKKATFSSKYGKLKSSRDSFAHNSLSYYSSYYKKPMFNFYDFTLINGIYSFYIKKSDIDKYVSNINNLIFLNPVFNASVYVNYKQSISNDFMRINTIKEITVNNDKYYMVTTYPTKNNNLKDNINVTLNPSGYLYFNNFKTLLKNNTITNPKNLPFLATDAAKNPIEFISLGDDNYVDIKIIDNKDITTYPASEAQITEEDNNIVINTDKIEYDAYKEIELQYLPNTVKVVFTGGNSEDNSSAVFLFNCGTSFFFEDGALTVSCGDSK